MKIDANADGCIDWNEFSTVGRLMCNALDPGLKAPPPPRVWCDHLMGCMLVIIFCLTSRTPPCATYVLLENQGNSVGMRNRLL